MTDIPQCELDRLVAERVMGWSWGSNNVPAGSDVFGDWQEAQTVVGAIKKPGGYFVSHWRPSGNLDHAWEVVKRLIALGHLVTVSSYGDRWMCGVGQRDEMGAMTHTAFEGSATLAICRAALLAVTP